jgi:hypothetical protein
MKNKKAYLFIAAAAIISLIGIYSFTNTYSFESAVSSAMVSVTDSTDTKTYTCPMHPEVISDKPGQCPKCGMDLKLNEDNNKKDEKKDAGHNHKGHKGCMGH